MEELVDVLDERGMYTGKTETRANCSKEGLWHKAVCVFIINSKSQVLLQKKSANKKTWPNMWDVTAGGNVLAGEFGFQAIIRECKEELGIELSKNDITFIGSVISTNKKGDIINKQFNECYLITKSIDVSEIKLQEEEVAEIKFFTKEEVLDRIKNNYDGLTDKTGPWNFLKRILETK